MQRIKSSSSVARRAAGQAIARLMPNVIRGVHMDFFLRREITQTQFLMLVAIRSYGHCKMSILAKSIHVRMPTASGIVNRLVKSGLVERRSEPEDRRRVVVALTPKGEKLIRQFQDAIRRRWQEVLRSLSAKELGAFHGVVTKLTKRLAPQGPHA